MAGGVSDEIYEVLDVSKLKRINNYEKCKLLSLTMKSWKLRFQLLPEGKDCSARNLGV